MTLLSQFFMETRRTPGTKASTATIPSSLNPDFSMHLKESVVVQRISCFFSIPNSTPVMCHADLVNDKCFTQLRIYAGSVVHIFISMVLLISRAWWGKLLNAMMSLASSTRLGGNFKNAYPWRNKKRLDDNRG